MTTTQKIKDKIAEIGAEAKVADKLVCDLAAGTKKWQMCVPPQDDDTDIMLVKQVRETIPSLLATLSELVEALDYVERRTDPEQKNPTEHHYVRSTRLRGVVVAALDRAADRFGIIEKGETR